VGYVTNPTTADLPWVAVSEQIQPADTPIFDTCGEALVSEKTVRASDGTTGAMQTYRPTHPPMCSQFPVLSSARPYTGPPVGFLTTYTFPLKNGLPHFAYCTVQDRESPASPDVRDAVNALVEQTLKVG
jgi:hypothetical protein